jgi:hypothetical protein
MGGSPRIERPGVRLVTLSENHIRSILVALDRRYTLRALDPPGEWISMPAAAPAQCSVAQAAGAWGADLSSACCARQNARTTSL